MVSTFAIRLSPIGSSGAALRAGGRTGARLGPPADSVRGAVAVAAAGFLATTGTRAVGLRGAGRGAAVRGGMGGLRARAPFAEPVLLLAPLDRRVDIPCEAPPEPVDDLVAGRAAGPPTAGRFAGGAPVVVGVLRFPALFEATDVAVPSGRVVGTGMALASDALVGVASRGRRVIGGCKSARVALGQHTTFS